MLRTPLPMLECRRAGPVKDAAAFFAPLGVPGRDPGDVPLAISKTECVAACEVCEMGLVTTPLIPTGEELTRWGDLSVGAKF